ncbi:MAG: hypothetical protein ABJO36_00645 [Litorimonas sp.]
MRFENDVDQLNALLGRGNDIIRLSVINPGVIYEDQKPQFDYVNPYGSQTKIELDLQPRPRMDGKPFTNRLVKIICEGVRDLKLEHGNLNYTELTVIDVKDWQQEGVKFQFGSGSYDSKIYFLCKSFTVEVTAIGVS